MRADKQHVLKRLDEACGESGLPREVFLHLVECELIHPAREERWQEEDVLRAQLIAELRNDFGVNDEAIPIILHLLDQLNALRALLDLKRAG